MQKVRQIISNIIVNVNKSKIDSDFQKSQTKPNKYLVVIYLPCIVHRRKEMFDIVTRILKNASHLFLQ